MKDLFSDIGNPQTWKEAMDIEFITPYLAKVQAILETERKQFQIFPSTDLSIILRCLNLEISKTKAVILGQDPYPNECANGLAFSSEIITPSLTKIEQAFQIGLEDSNFVIDPLLRKLSSKVLLLNSALTVRFKSPDSHKDLWRDFTVEVIRTVCNYKLDIPFFILGTQAAKLFEKSIKIHKISPEYYISEHPAFAARKGREYQIEGIDKLIKIVNGD